MEIKPYNNQDAKKEQVRDMFDRIAPKYDLLNHLLSMNVDRLWRRRVVRMVREKNPSLILDVATGTGDLAIDLARGIPDVHIHAVDLSEGMLEKAKAKIEERGLSERIDLGVEDAEQMTLPDHSVDVVTVGFGVRNFSHIDAGLREFARILKPGGALVILELSRPSNRFFRALFEFYFRKILPRIGGAISNDRKAYGYLPASVIAFPDPERFVEMMKEAGFTACKARSLSLGIARIYYGEISHES